MRLQKKVAVITGGGSGMGQATSLLFAEEGAEVIVADINSKNASIIQTCEIYLGQIFCSILEDYFYKKK